MDIIKGNLYINCFSGNIIEVTDFYTSCDDTRVVDFKIVERADGAEIIESENEYSRPEHAFVKCFLPIGNSDPTVCIHEGKSICVKCGIRMI